MSEDLNRRELKTRQSGMAQKTAKWISARNITPNQISILSVFFASAGAVSLYFFPVIKGNYTWLFPLLTAIAIQCRLLCNLFDGMVAVEGGKGTPAGELFNDIPDRLADSLFFIGAGYALRDFHELAVIVGWAAALLAVSTAYVRTLASSIGAPTDFCGPMAKQHRMFTLTLACLLTCIEPLISLKSGTILFAALIIICAGSLITAVRRAVKAYCFLENSGA